MSAQPLISDQYRSQQAELHKNADYGVASVHWAPTVADLARQAKPRHILDYGAGKGRLGAELAKLLKQTFELRQYEPAMPALAAPPVPSDLVACIDVLEHIEPDCLDAVLDDLMRVTAKIGIYTIATGPAMKTLPDGRNAHLIQRPPSWWLPVLSRHFEVIHLQGSAGGFWVVVMPKADGPAPEASPT